jgi:hypothetical protein
VSAATFPARKKSFLFTGFLAGFALNSLARRLERPSAGHKPADALGKGVLRSPVRSLFGHLVEASIGWLLFPLAVCSLFRS